MATTNDVTGDTLISKASSDYKDKYDSVFNSKVNCKHYKGGLCFKVDRSDTNSISAKCRKPNECEVKEL